MSLARSGRVAPLLALAILCVGLLVPLLAADGATVGSTLAVQYYNDSSCTVQNSLSLSYASTDNGGCGLYQGSSSPTAYVKYTCSNVTATNISVTATGFWLASDCSGTQVEAGSMTSYVNTSSCQLSTDNLYVKTSCLFTSGEPSSALGGAALPSLLVYVGLLAAAAIAMATQTR